MGSKGTWILAFEWYESLSAIIGTVDSPIEIDRSRLPGVNLRPQLPEWHRPGETEYWQWPSLEDDVEHGSQSPASYWSSQEEREPENPSSVLKRVYEAILLPGEASDYHFALLGAYSALWGMRRRNSTILASIEQLCLLDLRLCEAKPEALQITPEDETPRYYRIPAFEYLIRSYSIEGFLHEALSVAEQAVRRGQEHHQADVDQLRERISAIEAEDG